MALLSDIYDVTLKLHNRDACKQGWVRPTIGESFISNKDFTKISKLYDIRWDQEARDFSTAYTFSMDGMVATVNHEGWHSIWINRETTAADGNVFFEITVGGPAQLGFSTQYYSEILTQSPYSAVYYPQYSTVVYGFAVNAATNYIGVYGNGTFQGNNPYSNYIHANMGLPTSGSRFTISTHYEGDAVNTLNLGQKPWAYPPPEGYVGYLS